MYRVLPSFLVLLAACTAAQAAKVDVTVTNIDASGGDVRVVLYDDVANWLTHHGGNVLAATAKAGQMTFTYPDVKPGHYAILVYHDTNRNQDLDENFLGIPTEQFGFSNDPGYKHEPKMAESMFTVTDQPVTLGVRLSDD